MGEEALCIIKSVCCNIIKLLPSCTRRENIQTFDGREAFHLMVMDNNNIIINIRSRKTQGLKKISWFGLK